MTESNTAASEQLKKIKELVDEVYALQLDAKVAEDKFKKAKTKLSDIMKNADVEKMQGDTCNASLALKTSVSCPKSDAEKLQLFEYLALKDLGDLEKPEEAAKTIIKTLNKSPTLLNMLTINARTFSSWHNKEVEAKALEGDFEFKLSMIEPYEYYSVGLRKRTVK